MRVVASVAVAVLGMASPLAAQEPHPPGPDQKVMGFYVGMLPCADCPGLRTELTLLSDASGRTSYWLKETYLGKPAKDASFESGGSWHVERASFDPSATVYRLVEARSSGKRFLLKVSDDELRMLDREGRPLESKLGNALKRVPAASNPSR